MKEDEHPDNEKHTPASVEGDFDERDPKPPDDTMGEAPPKRRSMKIICEYGLTAAGEANLSEVRRYGPFEDPEAVLLALGALNDQYLSYVDCEGDRPGDWEDAWAIPNPNLEQELIDWAKRENVTIVVKDGMVSYDKRHRENRDLEPISIEDYLDEADVNLQRFSRVFEILKLESEIPAQSPFKKN